MSYYTIGVNPEDVLAYIHRKEEKDSVKAGKKSMIRAHSNGLARLTIKNRVRTIQGVLHQRTKQ